MSMPRVQFLLAWCDESGIQIDPGIHLVESGNHQELGDSCSSSPDHGISVYSLEDHIDRSCVLVRIPKTTILSAKSCSLSQDITSAPYGHAAHLALALALYGEILRGQDSKWFGYIQSLPRETVDIAIFWGVEDVIDYSSGRGHTAPSQSADVYVASNVGPICSTVEFPDHTPSLQLLDGEQAQMWLRCTEAGKELDGLMDEIRQYYVDIVEPTLQSAFGGPWQKEVERDITSASESESESPRLDQHSKRLNPVEPSLPGFCHAYSLVSSRAFSVDLHHGLAMVPIADAFNHSNENHVHMESDFDVCVECGSLAECSHDSEPISDAHSREVCSLPEARILEADTLDMCAVKPIPPLSEVFNTYGSLSNSELISRYGFVLPENDRDIVRLGYGSFSSFINKLVLVHSSTAGGRDADIYGHSSRDRDANVPQDVHAASHEPDFANALLRVYSYLARRWMTEARWDEMDDDGMVYNDVSLVSSPWPLREDPDAAVPDIFNVNVEGKLTHLLWLFCVVFAACIGSPEMMTDLAVMICSNEDDPRLQQLMEDMKQDLLDVQDYVDNARQMTESGDEALGPASLGICSYVRDDASNVGSRPGDTDNLDHAATGELARECSGVPAALAQAQSIPGVPLEHPRAIVQGRRLSVEEERFQKRPRLSTLHAFGSEGDLPRDVFDRVSGLGGDIVRTRYLTLAAQDRRASTARILACIVVHLCQHRMDYGNVSDGTAFRSLTAAEIGELLDVTPLHMHRTRVAMLLALSEKSILESCAAAWSSIRAIVTSG